MTPYEYKQKVLSELSKLEEEYLQHCERWLSKDKDNPLANYYAHIHSGIKISIARVERTLIED